MAFEPGAVVRLRGTGETGAVLRMLGGQQAEVLVGNSRRVVHVDDIESIGADPLDSLVAGKPPGSARAFALRLQAIYLHHAYRYDPRSGLSNARIEPQLHQLSVAHRVADKLRPRLILADEVGLGKTIEAGLILKELRARGLIERSLIVTPASLQEQWQNELRSKFNEAFDRIDGPTARFLAQGGQNPFLQRTNVICSLNIAVRWADHIRDAGWDLIIFDEAHRVRRSKQLGKVSTTKAYELADQLKDEVFGLLLLTATPMQLTPFELYSMIDLVEPGLYESEADYERERRSLPELNDLMKSLDRWHALSNEQQAEEVRRHGPTLQRLGLSPAHAVEALRSDAELRSATERLITLHPLSEVLTRNRKAEVGGFKKRRARRELVALTPTELAAYERVSEYLRNRYLRSENSAIGFLMVTYQKMLASSSFALKQSLLRRLDKLHKALIEQAEHVQAPTEEFDDLDWDPSDEEFDRRLSLAESMTTAGIQDEIEDIEALMPTIDAIRDTKLDRLVAILTADVLATREKVLVFTQFTDTQTLITKRLEALDLNVTTFNGRMDLTAKEESVKRFRSSANVMISTEAGGEGRNFQFAHHLVNYDLPWNPMKVEQRIGRLDRIGQAHDVLIVNLACQATIEERVLEVLENRIRLFEESVGALDPILGAFESQFTAVAMAAPPATEADFRRIEEEVEGHVREANHQERLFADLLLDRASLRRDKANRILNTPPLATPADLRSFVRDALEYCGGNLEEHSAGGAVISLSPQLAADLGVRGQTLRGTFDPAEALRLEELQFFTIDHDVISRLTQSVLSEEFPTIATRRLRRAPAGQFLEVYYEMTAHGFRPRGRFIRHLVGEDGVVHEEDVIEVPPSGESVSADLPLWLAAAADASRARMLKRHDNERASAAEDEARLRDQEVERADRIFHYQAKRLNKVIAEDEALAARLERGTEDDKRAVRLVRGRVAKNQERLTRLQREHENRRRAIDSRRMQVHFAPVAAAFVTQVLE